MKNKSDKKRLKPLKYIIHPARIGSWVEEYDDEINVECMGEVYRVFSLIQESLRREFPRATVPHQEFEFLLNSGAGSLRVPMREQICLAVDQVALIMGLSRIMTIDGTRPTPEDFTAPTCVIDAVTDAFKIVLGDEIQKARSNPKYPEGNTLSFIIEDTIDNARTEAVCAAVDALDGITPDCNREALQFMITPRRETGPPDPFSSKSRFRNSLIQALLWFPLPKKDYLCKPARKVTEEDLAYYFCQLGYLDSNYRVAASQASTNKRTEHGETGGNDRTIRRWMTKYTAPTSRWLSLRSDLIAMIKRTGYDLR